MTNGYSPTLSLITAAFEIGAALWVLRGPGDLGFLRRVSTLLVVLAGYQLAEVFVCANPENLLYAKLAFCDIVWLPPLGLSLLAYYAEPVRPWVRHVVRGSFVYAGAMCVWVFVDPANITGTVCSTVLAMYKHDALAFHFVYGGFYEAGLLALIIAPSIIMKKLEDPRRRALMADLQLGVVGFVFPAFITQISVKSIDPAIPSLMCHYAIVLAIFLVVSVRRERRLDAIATTDGP